MCKQCLGFCISLSVRFNSNVVLLFSVPTAFTCLMLRSFCLPPLLSLSSSRLHTSFFLTSRRSSSTRSSSSLSSPPSSSPSSTHKHSAPLPLVGGVFVLPPGIGNGGVCGLGGSVGRETGRKKARGKGKEEGGNHKRGGRGRGKPFFL